MRAVLAGLHNGAAVCALENTIPRSARRSMFGVLTCGCPSRGPTQSLRSSMAMKRISGRESGCANRHAGVTDSATRQAIAPASVFMSNPL